MNSTFKVRDSFLLDAKKDLAERSSFGQKLCGFRGLEPRCLGDFVARNTKNKFVGVIWTQLTLTPPRRILLLEQVQQSSEHDQSPRMFHLQQHQQPSFLHKFSSLSAFPSEEASLSGMLLADLAEKTQGPKQIPLFDNKDRAHGLHAGLPYRGVWALQSGKAAFIRPGITTHIRGGARVWLRMIPAGAGPVLNQET